MAPETRQKLQNFDLQELRQELLIRGAATHAVVAAALAPRAPTLAGSPGLVAFSSRDIAESLRERQKVIYSVDNRQDVFEVIDESVRRNADAVVSLFRASRIRDNGDGTSTLGVGRFGQVNSLCEDEPFFDQPAGAFCSGFLVAPDLIATAGHCVDAETVATVRFVFGFRMIDAANARSIIPNGDIYSGVAIVGRELTDTESDWCVVRLDRPVADKHILALRRDGKIGDEQSVYVIGHPSGLPAKFADGAAVRENSGEVFFVANLDTYGGNSGSPVFNGDTHEVEGILVRGATDFVPVGFCMVSAVCPTSGCRGEDCTRVSEFAHLVPES